MSQRQNVALIDCQQTWKLQLLNNFLKSPFSGLSFAPTVSFRPVDLHSALRWLPPSRPPLFQPLQINGALGRDYGHLSLASLPSQPGSFKALSILFPNSPEPMWPDSTAQVKSAAWALKAGAGGQWPGSRLHRVSLPRPHCLPLLLLQMQSFLGKIRLLLSSRIPFLCFPFPSIPD